MNFMQTKYPTIDEVNAADHVQICRWVRFLPSPGLWTVGLDTFEEELAKEVLIMERICARLHEFGGMTSEISKMIGWNG
jgi:hypothetical protein